MSLYRFMMISIVMGYIIIPLSGCSTKPSLVTDQSLVKVACPQLTPLSDSSFGATTAKLVEIAGQYNICRTAALAGVKR